MIELDFMVPPQVMAGAGAFGNGTPVDVFVGPATAGDAWLCVGLSIPVPGAPRQREVLASGDVLRTEVDVLAWVIEHAQRVGVELDRRHARSHHRFGV